MGKVVLQSIVMGLIAGGGYFVFETYGPAQAPVRAYEEFVRARRMNHYDITRALAVGPAMSGIMRHEVKFDEFLASLESGDRTQQREMYGRIHDIFVEIKSKEVLESGAVGLVGVETVRRLKGNNPMIGVDPTTDYEQKVELRNYSNGWKVYSFEERIIIDPNETRRSSHAEWGRLAK